MSTVIETRLRRGRTPASVPSGPVRVGLFGEFGWTNIGNDASLDAVIASIRRLRPDAVLTCVCPEPALVSAAHSVDAVSMNWLGANPGRFARLPGPARKVLAKVADIGYLSGLFGNLDTVVVAGTGICEQFGVLAWGMPFALFRLGAIARWRKTSVAYVNVGVEPASSRASRWLMRQALALADYRSYRDEYSRVSASSLGVDVDEDRVFCDVAFGLPRPEPVSATPGLIGLGVMGYHGPSFTASVREATNERYVAKLVGFASGLLAAGDRIRLLTADNADVATAERVLRQLRLVAGEDPERIEFTPARTIDELTDQVADCEAVVATRYHNLIAALRIATPVVSLGYAPKNEALMSDLGLGQFCQSVADFDADRLADQLAQARHDAGEIRQTLLTGNARYEEALGVQAAELDRTLFAQTRVS